MNDSMLYKMNQDIVIKQDSSDIESDSSDIIDIFYIGDF